VFVTEDMIAEMIERYGSPHEREYRFEVTSREFKRIRSSQKHGRNHDVTLYVEKDGRLIVIAKPFYPQGIYRAPSGGLNPGESFEGGITREVAEEIGCEIKLERFLLRTRVDFNHNGDTIRWRSFVFLARYVRGDFNYSDHDEIREVKLVDWEDFDDFGRWMRQTEIGGLHYRAALHETVVELLNHGWSPSTPSPHYSQGNSCTGHSSGYITVTCFRESS
jgi:ADP-ribose pyrophosphatase YjhB (NUDIX family)